MNATTSRRLALTGTAIAGIGALLGASKALAAPEPDSAVDRDLLAARERVHATNQAMNEYCDLSLTLAEEKRWQPYYDALCERETAAQDDVWAILGKYPENLPLSRSSIIAISKLAAANAEDADDGFRHFKDGLVRIIAKDIAEFGVSI